MPKEKGVNVPAGFKEVKGDELIYFENPGDSITGEYVGKVVDVGEYKSKIYTYHDTDRDMKKSFFGSVVIDRLMTALEPGDKFHLVFIGKVKSSSGRKVNDFKLFKR